MVLKDDAVLSLCGMSSLPVCALRKTAALLQFPLSGSTNREYLAGGMFFLSVSGPLKLESQQKIQYKKTIIMLDCTSQLCSLCRQ